MTEKTFADFTQGSAIRKFGRAGMARNAAAVLGNAGGREHLAALERAAQRDPSPAVRCAARWAARRIRERPSR
jgi:epoxyqueuosine reductase QueG